MFICLKPSGKRSSKPTIQQQNYTLRTCTYLQLYFDTVFILQVQTVVHVVTLADEVTVHCKLRAAQYTELIHEG